jgi:hypothetical protein
LLVNEGLGSSSYKRQYLKSINQLNSKFRKIRQKKKVDYGRVYLAIAA